LEVVGVGASCAVPTFCEGVPRNPKKIFASR
jgi:hypothetical protein